MSSPERTCAPETETKPRIAFGFYYPETVLTNKEIESWGVRTNSGSLLTAKAILKKTGVEKRFVAGAEDVILMGLKATEPIIEKVDSQFDSLIFATTYPTGAHLSTKTSYFIRPIPCDTLDVHAACSSFVFAFNFLSPSFGKRVLMIASEKISPTLANLKNGEEDPSLSQTIFSDGAAALSFVYGRDLKILAIRNFEFNLEESGALRMPIDFDLIADSQRFSRVEWIWSPPSGNGRVEMDGKTVYEAVVRKMPSLITETICAANLRFSDIGSVIPHQASKHMLDGIAKRLPPDLAEKMVYDLEDGNFSSASIPKAWMKATQEGRIKSGDKIVLAGVGAGLFASIAVVEIG